MANQDWTVAELVEDYKAGRVSRRSFVARLAAIGVSISAISLILQACGSDDKKDSGSTSGSTSGTSNSGSSGSAATTTSGGSGTQAAAAPTKRGGGGTLKLLWWQAPSILNPHQSSGTKDRDGSRIFLEPLAGFDKDGNIVPILAAEAPSVDKGTIDKAGKFVTWKLKQGVKWHDGKPFTADDVIFTWKYAVDKDTAALTVGNYTNVENVEKVSDYEVKVSFKTPTVEWSAPFVGGSGMILPKHIHEPFLGAQAKSAPANLKPIGTGPYKLVDFKPNDIIVAEINNDYHEANKPFFDRVEMKGGGDAPSAARAVLQTGEYDYAWNLQVEWAVLNDLAKNGAGELAIGPGSGLEHIQLNYTDPNKEVDGEKSSLKAPHPFFTDLKVRQAFALAINRKLIVDELYGKTGEIGLWYLWTPKKYTNEGKWEFNLQKAGQLLDEAGWKKGSDGIREKNGVKMKVVWSTSVNGVRQAMQNAAKKDLESIGISVEIKAVIADVFFAADPANPDNFSHFYTDVQSYTYTRGGPDDALTTFNTWLTSQIKQKSNNWAPQNAARYSSKEFDDLHAQASKELDPVKFADLVKKMNQKLIDDVAVIPVVGRNNAGANKKGLKNMNLTPWDSDIWNLRNWSRG